LSRLQQRFAELAASGRKALIPYIVAGDPAPELTVPLLHALVAAGADAIELGIPFSDPMAEGPVIQVAHERALAHRTSLRRVLAMVAEFRQRDAQTPLVLMGYANPVEVMGYEACATSMATAGADALLLVDMPPEEATELNASLAARGLDSIYLVAPTTTEERTAAICRSASGYVYYVSVKGVTGAGNLDPAAVGAQVAQVRQYTRLPVCVGFGIKDGASASAIARHADGVIVGSALVQNIAGLASDGRLDPADLAPAVSLVVEIRQALDHPFNG